MFPVLNDEDETWEWYDDPAPLLLTIHRADGASALSHSGPFEDIVYEGEMAGHDFTAILDWIGDVGPLLRCSDGTEFGTVVCGDEITGRFSEDDRSFTATKRSVCRQVSTGASVLTRSWTWSGKKD